MNDHGIYFLDFLIDNTLFILNGRFNIQSNKYTSVSTRASAVVDCVIMRQKDIKHIKSCQIFQMTDISDNVKYMISDKYRIPDQSIVMCELCITYYNENVCYSNNKSSKEKTNVVTNNTYISDISRYKFKFNYRKDFMNIICFHLNIQDLFICLQNICSDSTLPNMNKKECLLYDVDDT